MSSASLERWGDNFAPIKAGDLRIPKSDFKHSFNHFTYRSTVKKISYTLISTNICFGLGNLLYRFLQPALTDCTLLSKKILEFTDIPRCQGAISCTPQCKIVGGSSPSLWGSSCINLPPASLKKRNSNAPIVRFFLETPFGLIWGWATHTPRLVSSASEHTSTA